MRLHDRRIAPYLVMGFVFGFTMATVHQLAGFYFQDMLSLDAIGTARHVGIALVGMAIASLSAQFLIVRRYKLPPKPLLRAGIPLVVVGIAALIAAPVFEALVASLFIVGFGFGLTMPAYSAAATLSVGPYEQGRVAGLTMAAMSLGFVVGPLLGTALYQWDHHAAFFVDLVLFTALFAFTFAIRLPDPRADAAKAP